MAHSIRERAARNAGSRGLSVDLICIGVLSLRYTVQAPGVVGTGIPSVLGNQNHDFLPFNLSSPMPPGRTCNDSFCTTVPQLGRENVCQAWC